MEKKLFGLIAVLIFFISVFPTYVYAHVKWFTEVIPQKENLDHIISPLFMGVALISALIISVLPRLVTLMEKSKYVRKIDNKLDSYRKYSRYILKYGTATALALQHLSGRLFAPEFPIHNQTVLIILWIAIICLFIPHHIFTKIGALIVLGLFFMLTMEAGIFHMLDYGFYVAIIIVLLVGNTKAENWGFSFLYLATGLSICWVAVEKWVYPSMVLDVVYNHGVPTFGFAPETFVVLCAFIEFVIGYLLVVGILNRLLGVVVTLMFICTSLLFGMIEVVGHFMIHIILLIFVIEDVSFYNPPVKYHKTMLNQMIFVFLNYIFVLVTILVIYYRFA